MTDDRPHNLATERSRLVRLARHRSALYVMRTVEYFERLLHLDHEFVITDEEHVESAALLFDALHATDALYAVLSDLHHSWIGMSREARRIELRADRNVRQMFEGHTGIPTFAGMLAELREAS